MNNFLQDQQQNRNLSPNLLSKPDRNYTPLIHFFFLATLTVQIVFILVVTLNIISNALLEYETGRLNKTFNAISRKSDIFDQAAKTERKINIIRREGLLEGNMHKRIEPILQVQGPRANLSNIRIQPHESHINFTTQEALHAALVMENLLKEEAISALVLESASLAPSGFQVSLRIIYR